MSKYKCLANDYISFKEGCIYDGSDKGCMYTVEELAKSLSNNWEIVEDDFVLPEKWYILWKSKEIYEITKNWTNVCWRYSPNSGVNYKKQYISYTENLPKGYTEITLEQFKKYVLKLDDMKYNNTVIKVLNREHGREVIAWWKEQGVDTGDFSGVYCEEDGDTCIYYGIIDGVFNNYPIHKIPTNVKIIELPKEDKEIIGYKLKPECEIYKTAISTIVKICESLMEDYSFSHNSTIHKKLIDAGVMHWFEPVYKPKYSLPKINGYEGKIDGNCIKYGCANLHIEKLRNILESKELSGCRYIKSITLSSDVTITIDEIKQIVNYFDNM